jgi:hypothetical protein
MRTGLIWFRTEFRDELCGADDSLSIMKPTGWLLFNLLKIKSLHVSSVTWSASGGATLTALGILRACYVSWLHLVHSRNIPSAVCVAPPEDEQVIFKTCRGS